MPAKTPMFESSENREVLKYKSPIEVPIISIFCPNSLYYIQS